MCLYLHLSVCACGYVGILSFRKILGTSMSKFVPCSGACRGGFLGASGNPLKFPANENLKSRNTLIEHSNNLLKQSRAVIVPCHH